MSFANGSRVQMDGLISAPYQNGRHGTVIRYSASRKKYVVQLDYCYMSGPQERFQAKAKNLLPVDRSEEDRIRLLLYENDATHYSRVFHNNQDTAGAAESAIIA
jgi:hypothetical protein